MAEKKTKTDDILALAKERFETVCTADKDERKQAEDDLKFAINDENCQWPADVLKQRTEATPPRPCLVINKIPEKIDQVSGEFKQLRPSIKVSGVDGASDPTMAQIIAGCVRHIERNSDAMGAYVTCHDSNLYCGRGAWRVDIEDAQDDPFVRDIVINRIPNALSIYWDPNAKKKDKSDAKYCFVIKEVTKNEYKNEYGDKDGIEEWDTETTQWGDNWHNDSRLRIAEYWWKKKEEKTFYQVEREGEVQTVEALEDGETSLKEKTVKVDKVCWCILTVGRILEGPHYDWPIPFIPIAIELGKEVNVGGKIKTRGMVRFAKVPCQMYNYWSSAITEQVALAPKSPYLVTGPMVGAYKSIWDSANITNNVYLPYDIDPKSPTLYPKRETPPQLSTAMANELQRLDHDIMSAMGIYQASLGDRGDEKSGKAITAKQRQGSIGAYPFTSNFETALIYSTKIIIRLIPKVYDTERIVRILGEDGKEQAVALNARPGADILQNQKISQEMMVEPKAGITKYINDITVGKYDVAVSIGPSYTTQREEALNMMMDLIKAMPQAAPNIADLLVQNMDVKGADELTKRFQKMLPPGIREPDPGEQPPPEQPPPPEVVKAQMENQAKQAELALKEQELMIKQQEQQRKNYETKINAMVDMFKAEMEAQNMDAQRIIELTNMAKQQTIGAP